MFKYNYIFFLYFKFYCFSFFCLQKMTQPSRELQSRCKAISERMSESMHIIDHDPSMAFYRLQEHVNKTVPVLVNRKYEMMKTNSVLQGATYDIDNSIEAIKEMQKASTTFERILEMLRDSTFVKQQMDYEKAKMEQQQQSSSFKRKK